MQIIVLTNTLYTVTVCCAVQLLSRYNADEARNLKQYGELPEHARINETAVDIAMDDGGDGDDIGIDFDDI
jgi:translation initiation factor 1A